MEYLAVLLIILFLFLFWTKKNMMWFFFISALFLAILAFFYHPNQYADLYRHYIMLDEFKYGGWEYVKNTHYYDTQPLFAIYVFLISILPHQGYLPAITVFLAYILPFRVIYLYTQENKIGKIYIFLILLFILTAMSYLGVMGGIRNMLAFSIFSFFLYFDLIKNKRKIYCYIIYILLCLFHSSVIILVILRILLSLTKYVPFYILAIFSFILPNINVYLMQITSFLNGISFFIFLEEQITSYSSGGTVYVYSTAIFRTLALIIIFAGVVLSIIQKDFSSKYSKKYRDYVLLTIMFTLGSINQYDVYVRMVSFLIFASPIVILTSLAVTSKGSLLKYGISEIRKKQFDISKLKMILFLGIISVSLVSITFYTWSEYVKITYNFK